MIPVTRSCVRDGVSEALTALAAERPEVVVIESDVGKSTRTWAFGQRYPDRFYDVGICEQNQIGVAAGLSTIGYIPVVTNFATFLAGRGFEQVRNLLCRSHLNVKLVPTHAGLSPGRDGSSHQSFEDVAIMRTLPGMTVLVPADRRQTAAAILAAAQHVGPVYVRVGRNVQRDLYAAGKPFVIGAATRLREGTDVSIVACGAMVEVCLEAAEALAQVGIACDVLDMSTIKPLDVASLRHSALKTGVVVTAEEHSVVGGLGEAVCAALADWIPVPVLRLGIPDRFGESGETDELFEEMALSTPRVTERIREFVRERRAGRPFALRAGGGFSGPATA